jgi:hypothetical protein
MIDDANKETERKEKLRQNKQHLRVDIYKNIL